MDIVIGSGRGRKVVTLPALRSRVEQEQITEDTKALVLRPATFSNHSKKF